jgi:hypothetical protein
VPLPPPSEGSCTSSVAELEKVDMRLIPQLSMNETVFDKRLGWRGSIGGWCAAVEKWASLVTDAPTWGILVWWLQSVDGYMLLLLVCCISCGMCCSNACRWHMVP